MTKMKIIKTSINILKKYVNFTMIFLLNIRSMNKYNIDVLKLNKYCFK